MLHTTLSRKGGQVSSPAKTAANRAKASAYWAEVRAGKRPAPRRPRTPPAPDVIADKLAAYCETHGITRVEVFGSTARGTARRGSDVDLMVTFSQPPGLRFFTMAEEVADILGAPVDLVTRENVEAMTNPFRQHSILADARQIFPR